MAAENEIDVREEDDGSAVILDPNEPAPKPEPVDPPEGDDEGAPSPDEAAEHAEEEAAAATDAEREAIRARRREERAQKKEHQKQLVSNLRAELDFERRQRQEMAERLANLERRGTSADMAAIDAGINQAQAAEQQLRTVLADAITKQDGNLAAQVTDRLLNVKREQDRLNGLKQNVQRQQSQPAPLAPEMVDQATKWMGRNTWYRPGGNDTDSAIVMLLDTELSRAGFDPRTEAYWQELDRRVSERLPHRKPPAHNPSPSAREVKPARTPVTASGRDSGGAQGSSQGTYRLSAERVQALKDAGMWDDSKSRADAIQRFREFDRKAASGSARS
jgi:hypothetical protein